MFFDFKNLLYFSLDTVKIMSLLCCFTSLQGTLVHIFRTMQPLSLSGLISSVPYRFPTTDKFSRFLHLALNQASEKPFMTSTGLKNHCFCHVQVSSASCTAAKIQGLTSRHLLHGLRCKSLQQCADQECGLVPKSQPTQWRQPLLPLLGVPQVGQATQLSHVCGGPQLVPCRLPICWSRLCELLRAQVTCFFVFPCDVLDAPGSYNSSSLSSAGFLSLAQCLAMGLCICFHQLLHKGSLITVTVVTKL